MCFCCFFSIAKNAGIVAFVEAVDAAAAVAAGCFAKDAIIAFVVGRNASALVRMVR